MPDVYEVGRLVEYQEGSVVSRTVLKKPTGTVTAFAFDAGQGLSEHTVPYDALAHIVDGTVEITVGGEKYRLGAGQMIVLPAGVPHEVQAAERFKMLLTMIRS